jgi:hypothetical protein
MAPLPLAGEDFTRHKKRSQAAWGVRDQWQKALFDAYNYVAPYRLSTRWVTKSPQNRVDLIFDNTAVMAHVRSVGRLQQDLFPTGEPFFTLDLGPAAEAMAQSNGGKLDDWKQKLEQITDVCNAVFTTGEWDAACSEMISDLLISTGFLMILKGTAKHPVRFVSASMDEIAIDEGPYGSVHGVFWKRKWSIRAILEAWPNGKYSPEFQASGETKGEEEIVLCQDVVWNEKAQRWSLYVYLEQAADEMIHAEESRECPWITPRYFRMPGQVYGFGPVLMTLPTVKSLNKAMEITLKAAALSMLGIFTRVDDGVFNPDTARLEPGAIWTVARNGGPLGPSIARLQPGPIDVNNIVLQDLRMQVQSGMQDQQLPPDGSSPRSAAEIMQRVKQLGQDHAGAYGRLVHEIVIPVVKRVLEVLYDMGVFKDERIAIDQLLVKVKVTSPLAQAGKARDAQTYLQWVQMCMALDPTGALARQVTPLEQGLAELGGDIGVKAHLIYPADTRQSIASAIEQGVQAAMAAMQKQQQQQQNPPPANGDPAQGMAA